MSLAAFVADQRTGHGVPHAVSCRALEVSQSWLYKWLDRPPTPAELRRGRLDAAVQKFFEDSGRSYGSPRIHTDLVEAGWRVSVNTVAVSMDRLGLVARGKKRRKNLTRPDKSARPFADLLQRDFTAAAPNLKWVGDMTEIPTGEGKLYLATTIDLFSRRLLGAAMSVHPDAELARQAIKVAIATRGGDRAGIAGVIFHSDKGSTYTANDYTKLCRAWDITQSMGRVGSCFDNAAAESFFSTLEFEVLSRYHFTTMKEARQVVARWIWDFYNGRRRHSKCGMQSPVNYEKAAAQEPEAA